jgi:hypothetical protein
MDLSILYEDELHIVREATINVSIKVTGAPHGPFVENPRLGTGEFHKFDIFEFSDGVHVVALPFGLLGSRFTLLAPIPYFVLIKDGKAFTEPLKHPNWMNRYTTLARTGGQAHPGVLKNWLSHLDDMGLIKLALREMEDEGRLKHRLPA